jgi:hypothetical protein
MRCIILIVLVLSLYVYVIFAIHILAIVKEKIEFPWYFVVMSFCFCNMISFSRLLWMNQVIVYVLCSVIVMSIVLVSLYDIKHGT